MGDDWNTPPTPAEMSGGHDPWAAPPTPHEMQAAGDAPGQSFGSRVLGGIGKAVSAVKGGVTQGLNDIGSAYHIPQALSALGLKPSESPKPQPAQGILKKDSPDWLAGIDAFVGGMPGAAQPYATPGPEHEARAGKFAGENPISTLGLSLLGGLGQPMPAGPAKVPGVPEAPGALSRFGAALEKMGISSGRRAMEGGGKIAVTKPLSEGAVREALDSNAIRPFGTIEGTSKRLQALREIVGDQYGSIVKGLKDEGVDGPAIAPLAKEFSGRAKDAANNSIGSPAPGIYQNAAEDLSSRLPVPPQKAPPPNVEALKMMEAERAAGNPVATPARQATPGKPGALNLDLDQAENIKRSLQRQVNYNKFDDTLGQEAKKVIASRLRQAVEDSIEQAGQQGSARVSELADKFVPVKQRLGNLIEGSDVAEKAAARFSRNSGHSLTDSVATAGGAAAGGVPGAVAGGVANKLWRTRGPSTMAWGEYKAGGMVQKLGQMAITDPGRLGRFAAPLANAVQRGPDALAVAHFALSTDPEYQKMTKEATNDGAAQ